MAQLWWTGTLVLLLLNKISALPKSNKERKQFDRPEVSVVFCLVIFLLNQSKNNAILKPRKEHIRVLVGFETKVKEEHP